MIAGCTQGGPAVKTADSAIDTGDLFAAATIAGDASASAASSTPEEEIVIEQNPGPGPYVGTAIGYYEYGGTVTVTLEVADRKITSAKVTGPRETAGIGSQAIDTMGEAMLKANSVKIDVVSGATHSSEAVLLAATRALAKAGLTNADLKR